MTAPAFNVVRGRMVLEEAPDFLARRREVANRLTPKTCRKCGGEEFSHLPVNGVLCVNWSKSLGSVSPTWMFEQQVARIVGRRAENIEALGQTLREALSPPEDPFERHAKRTRGYVRLGHGEKR